MRYAIGDVHGCLKELKELLEIKLQVDKKDELYFVGDIITKGSDSLGVIHYIQSLQ